MNRSRSGRARRMTGHASTSLRPCASRPGAGASAQRSRARPLQPLIRYREGATRMPCTLPLSPAAPHAVITFQLGAALRRPR